MYSRDDFGDKVVNGQRPMQDPPMYSNKTLHTTHRETHRSNVALLKNTKMVFRAVEAVQSGHGEDIFPAVDPCVLSTVSVVPFSPYLSQSVCLSVVLCYIWKQDKVQHDFVLCAVTFTS